MIKALWTKTPAKKELRSFSFTVGLISLFFLAWAIYRSNVIFSVIFVLILFSLLLGLIWSAWQILCYRLWMSAVFMSGAVMSRLILTLIFYLIFTPLALILKILKQQPLDLKWDKTKASYWLPREKKQSDLLKMH